MDNVRTMRFVGNQGAEDLYRCQETSRIYIRQPCDDTHVRWLTSVKWRGGYEADSPLRAGLVMRVVDKNNNVLYEEQIVHEDGYCWTVAETVGYFESEALDILADSVVHTGHLKSYEEWKDWMMKSAKDHGYDGYRDNWLYGEVSYEDPVTMFSAEILGKRVYVVREQAMHNISKQVWQCIEIRDSTKLDNLGICGYSFEAETNG